MNLIKNLLLINIADFNGDDIKYMFDKYKPLGFCDKVLFLLIEF